MNTNISSGLINIGGAHLTPPKRLPNELQKFLDESEHGVVYFSLGTVLKSSQLPKEKMQAFLGTNFCVGFFCVRKTQQFTLDPI